MRFVWLGFYAEGLPALEGLLAAGAPVEAVLTLRPDLAIRRSGGVDFQPLCVRHGVPLHYIANINDLQAQQLLCRLAPDVVFAIGWHQVVSPSVLRVASVGMIGAHASLLPHNRGSAPIQWALLRGERQTGNTLYWLAESVDNGDLIDRVVIPISPYDTCATLYQQVAASNRAMVLRLLPRLLSGERPGQPRPRTDESALPRRRAADGWVDWTQPSYAIFDLIRALTRPAPGAFSTLNGRRWRIWQAALPPASTAQEHELPGTILGPVVSPMADACGQIVACGDGGIILLELESDDGARLHGPSLSDQPWHGLRWDPAVARVTHSKPE